MGSLTNADDSSSELFLLRDPAGVEDKGNVDVKCEVGAVVACWVAPMIDVIDDDDGSTAGRGRNRWARLEIDIMSTGSFD